MDGWSLARIGDICEVVNGGTPKTDVSAYWGGPHWWITPAEMGKRSSPYVDQTRRTITDQGLQNSSARPLPPYSVILSSRAPIGHLVINTEPMATNQGCKGLIPRSQIDHKFLYYYLSSIVDLLNELGAGTTFKELSGSKLKEVQVPVPLIAEQRRIVTILDKAVEGIAIAIVNAEANRLKARELFEGYLQAVFTRGGPGWSSASINEHIRFIDYRGRTPEKTNEGLRLITAKNVKKGFIQREPMEFVSPDSYESWMTRGIPKVGDVLFTTEAPLGNAAQLDTEDRVVFAQRVIIMQADPAVLDSTFLKYMLLSAPFQAMIHSQATGATAQGIKASLLKRIQITFPPTLTEQRVIVNRLDALAEAARRLEALHSNKSALLEALKRTLLNQAFTGQLTATKEPVVATSPDSATTSLEFSATIIAFAYARHMRQQRDRTFGRVKEQKMLHLVEAIGKVDLGRQPMKDAAGPNDFHHMLKVEAWARRNGYFELTQREGGYDFIRLGAFDQLVANVPKTLGSNLEQIRVIVDLIVPMDKEEVEVFATVHAAWNNLLIDGVEVTDEAIVRESRDHWHADKVAIPAGTFWQAIELIRSKGFVPDGSGKYVGGQKPLAF